jgi:hypothetical protein
MRSAERMARRQDVERRLTDRIEELIERRKTLRRPAPGDRVLLPDRACVILDRFADLDFDPDFVAVQREALVLTRALAPEFFDSYLSQLEHRLNDPQHVDLLKRTREAESLGSGRPADRGVDVRHGDNLWPTANCW